MTNAANLGSHFLSNKNCLGLLFSGLISTFTLLIRLFATTLFAPFISEHIVSFKPVNSLGIHISSCLYMPLVLVLVLTLANHTNSLPFFIVSSSCNKTSQPSNLTISVSCPQPLSLFFIPTHFQPRTWQR